VSRTVYGEDMHKAAAEAEDTSSVARNLTYLQDQMATLGSAVEQLGTRLKPLRRNGGSANAELVRPTPEAGSPLAAEVAAIGSHAQDLVDQLRSILRDLDL
jgi:uncharacterized protein YlxW (UPF0749 family)